MRRARRGVDQGFARTRATSILSPRCGHQARDQAPADQRQGRDSANRLRHSARRTQLAPRWSRWAWRQPGQPSRCPTGVPQVVQGHGVAIGVHGVEETCVFVGAKLALLGQLLNGVCSSTQPSSFRYSNTWRPNAMKTAPAHEWVSGFSTNELTRPSVSISIGPNREVGLTAVRVVRRP